jgi:DeoR/GlpR family transcriptional regulator of sugar metabolism
MFASQRKQQILQILAVEKQVMSGELSQRFNVSEDSIRRDLRELAGKASCSGSTAARCRFRRPSRRSKQEKTCKSLQSRPLPAGRRR